jgi:hypothetical protein
MIEIISVKISKTQHQRNLQIFAGRDFFRRKEPGEHLEDLSARMSEPEHRWLLLEIDGRWKTLLPRTAERE